MNWLYPGDAGKREWGGRGLLQVGARVSTEWGEGEVIESSGRRVVIKLDNEVTPLNISTGTPGYDRIKVLK